MQTKTRIINAKDYLFREKHKSIKDRIKSICKKMVARGVLDTPFIDCEPTGKPVFAKVNFGQWLVECECGGAESVHWDEPIFYCFSCGNFENHGKPRTVIFPSEKERSDIERILLERPIRMKGGTSKIERIVLAIPAIKDKFGTLSRSWDPTDTIEDLRRENNQSLKGKVK